MSSTLNMKPIVLYGAPGGPNPWKIVMLFEELNIPYEHRYIDFHKVKEEPYTSLNPNGRLPTIEDSNTGLTLWESGAIIEYIIDTYDKDNKLNITTFPEKWQLKQFLHLQMSGQGPYYGQYNWFSNFHPEKVPTAISRYEEQVLRVVSVLDDVLEGKEYLVGDKFTYADLAFIPWEQVVHRVFPDTMTKTNKYANYTSWYKRVNARPAIKKTTETMAAEWAKFTAASKEKVV